MQRIIVTGGAGFIGSHLCERLLGGGYEVICVDNLLTSSERNVSLLKEYKNFTFLHHDVINPLPDIGKIDALFHLASPASPNHHSKLSYHALPLQTMLVNTTGTLELLKVAKKHNAKFLYTSSSEVYGNPLEHPQKETYLGNVSTTGPRSVYDEAKRFGETLVSYFTRDEELDGRIARVFNTYGPRMLKEDKRMIVVFILQALKGEPITLFGDGTQTRSLNFVSDTVEGLMRLMFTPGLAGEVVNIGNPEEHTVSEYATLVKKITNSGSEIILSEKLPKDDPIRRRPDISKAKELLGWTAKVTLEEGLKKTVQYFKNL